MTSEHQRRKAYESSAFRRKQQPFVMEVDGSNEFECKTYVDLADLVPLIDALQAPAKPGESAMAAAVRKVHDLVALIGDFIVDRDRPGWLELGPGIDHATLGQMTEDLVGEYTGRHPTQPASSPVTSPESGPSLTDIAAVEASTPSPSPSTEP